MPSYFFNFELYNTNLRKSTPVSITDNFKYFTQSTILTDMSMNLNIAWTITMALFIYLMHGGFGFYEAGMCRYKNEVDTLTHNLMILAITIVVFWFVGFGLMYGKGNSFMGLHGFFPALFPDSGSSFPSLKHFPVPFVVAFAFILAFVDTPATLIAGTGAERLQFRAVMIMCIVISGLIFPIVGHWVVGGGWLSQLSVPVYDGGSGYINLCGGSCALAVALLLGPRRGRFLHKEDEDKEVAVSSMPMVFLGAFILWIGFLTFNIGVSMKVSAAIGLITINTVVAGSFGTIVAISLSRILTGKVKLRTAIVGLLTANVAVTGNVAIITTWAAAVIGILAGFLAVGSMRLIRRFHIDDPTEYISMNFAGGILGLIAVGIFASPAVIKEYHPEPSASAGLINGNSSQMWPQLLACASIIIFSFSLMMVCCLVLKKIGAFRVSPQEEKQGADKATHGEKAEQKSDKK